MQTGEQLPSVRSAFAHLAALRHACRPHSNRNQVRFSVSSIQFSSRRDDNAKLTINMREAHSLCDKVGDVATASLLENWIDETEKRTWFLFECGRQA